MRRDKNIIVAEEMGALIAEMNHYHNSLEVYVRYLEKLEDPNEDKEIIEPIVESIRRYMEIRGIKYEERLAECRLVERFIKKRAEANGISDGDYRKKFGLRPIRL